MPVDLIVPAQLVPKAGRRGARLPRGHGKTAARKSDGVEGAVDVYRLFDATAVTDMAETTTRLLGDNRAAATTRQALLYVRELFATPRSPGIELAAQALAGVVDEASVTTVMTGYARELIGLTQS